MTTVPQKQKRSCACCKGSSSGSSSRRTLKTGQKPRCVQEYRFRWPYDSSQLATSLPALVLLFLLDRPLASAVLFGGAREHPPSAQAQKSCLSLFPLVAHCDVKRGAVASAPPPDRNQRAAETASHLVTGANKSEARVEKLPPNP